MLELIENPANAAVSGGVNVLGAQAGKDGAPTPTGGAIPTGPPLTHLSRSIEAIAASQQALEEAFLNRRKGLDELDEDEWEHLDLAAQEMIYGKLLAEIEAAGSGVEKLRDEAALAVILERHLWALWLKGNIAMQGAGLGIGSEIEDRLTKIGVAGLAGVDLTPWLWNEPDDWRALLLSWARAFNQPIYNG
jgi:hypothetical protein